MAACSAVSMPSATTSTPSVSASAMIARTRSDSLPEPVIPSVNERSILRMSMGNRRR
jgi:hypothetical protein